MTVKLPSPLDILTGKIQQSELDDAVTHFLRPIINALLRLVRIEQPPSQLTVIPGRGLELLSSDTPVIHVGPITKKIDITAFDNDIVVAFSGREGDPFSDELIVLGGTVQSFGFQTSVIRVRTRTSGSDGHYQIVFWSD